MQCWAVFFFLLLGLFGGVGGVRLDVLLGAQDLEWSYFNVPQ